jgi:hypothetical protein
MRPPVGLRNRWLSKEGTKGAVVVVVVVFGGRLAEAVVLEGCRHCLVIGNIGVFLKCRFFSPFITLGQQEHA